MFKNFIIKNVQAFCLWTQAAFTVKVRFNLHYIRKTLCRFMTIGPDRGSDAAQRILAVKHLNPTKMFGAVIIWPIIHMLH